MTGKIGSLGEKLCLGCGFLFCAVILLQSLITAAQAPLLPLLGAAAAGGLAVLAWKFWPLGDRATAAVVFLLRFALALGVILLVGGQPVQDFATMYGAAQDMASGSRAYLENVYFYNWAYQTGFAFYESLPLRIFGPGQFSLQVLNALWMGGSGVLVYGLARRLLPAREAAAAALLYAVYPAPYFLAGVLTNQHLAAFLLYLGLYLLVRREDLTLPAALLAGAVLALGNVMRPIGVVVLLAALCWRVVRRLLLPGGRREWLRELGVLLALGAGYFLLSALAARAVVWSGLNPEGLANNQPLWKFVLGFNQASSGAWNSADYETYLSLPPAEAREAMEQAVRERLAAGPWALLKLAWRKSQVMWGSLEYTAWGFGHLDADAPVGPWTVGQWTAALARLDKGWFLAAFALAAAGLFSLLRQGTRGDGFLLTGFLVCGYYAVHLLVEVQSRYRYFLMPAVFLLAGAGLAALARRRGRAAPKTTPPDDT